MDQERKNKVLPYLMLMPAMAVMMIVVDVLYSVLDPRISHEAQK